MNRTQSHVPRLALWVLEHLTPRRDREVVTGDLVETFVADRRPAVWFWRQVIVAVFVGWRSRTEPWGARCAFALAVAYFVLPIWFSFVGSVDAIEEFIRLGLRLPWPLSGFWGLGFRALYVVAVTVPVFLLFTWRAPSRLAALLTYLLVAVPLYAAFEVTLIVTELRLNPGLMAAVTLVWRFLAPLVAASAADGVSQRMRSTDVETA